MKFNHLVSILGLLVVIFVTFSAIPWFNLPQTGKNEGVNKAIPTAAEEEPTKVETNEEIILSWIMKDYGELSPKEKAGWGRKLKEETSRGKTVEQLKEMFLERRKIRDLKLTPLNSITQKLLSVGLINPGSIERIERVFYKASTVGNVNILIIGGSISMGHDAAKYYEEFLQDYFDERFPGKGNRVFNIANPASPSSYFSYCLEQTSIKYGVDLKKIPFDIFLIDFAVNDYAPAAIYGTWEETTSAYEDLVQTLLAINPDPVFIGLGFHITLTPNGLPCSNCSVEHLQVPVAKHYDFPYLSLRKVFLSETLPHSQANYFFNHVHLNLNGHLLVAQLLIGILEKGLGGLSHNSWEGLAPLSHLTPAFGGKNLNSSICYVPGPPISPNKISLPYPVANGYLTIVKDPNRDFKIQICNERAGKPVIFYQKNKLQSELFAVRIDSKEWVEFSGFVPVFNILTKEVFPFVLEPGCHEMEIRPYVDVMWIQCFFLDVR